MKATNQKETLALLSALMGLMRRTRTLSDPSTFAFLAVNETHLLSNYRQAALWRCDSGKGYIEAVSGLAVLDSEAPYILWLSQLLTHLETTQSTQTLALSSQNIPPHLAEEWNDWLPTYGLWLPLVPPGNAFIGGLFLTRETPWPREERQILEELVGTYALVWSNLLSQRTTLTRLTEMRLGRHIGWLLGFLALISLTLPIRQSVLAPAVVIAANPSLVRAPLNGVIDRFHVTPNQAVEKGQLLLSLDDTQLRNQLAVGEKEQEVALAEFRQMAQQAVRDPKAKSQTPILRKRWEQKKADVSYLRDRLNRVDLQATRHGIAVFADANDWIGRPVKLGERIVLVADPEQVELEIHLPVADAINLNPGAEVAMFLNIHAGSSLPAVLDYASYQAEITAEGLLAYRLKARFINPDKTPRIGLRGFARVYHDSITLFHFLTRRPLAAARQWLGI